MIYTISKFKAHFLGIVENLQPDLQPGVIIKKDQSFTSVMPLDSEKVSLLGMLKDKGEIKGDIIAPIDEQWDVQI